MNPLNNHRQSLILGIILALILAVALAGWPLAVSGPSLARWFHVVAGVFWIGLLYYFNVAQTPALADAAADKGGPGGRRRHEIRRSAGPVLVPLGGARDLARRRVAPQGKLRQRLHVPLGIRGDRHRRVARHDHAAQRLGG